MKWTPQSRISNINHRFMLQWSKDGFKDVCNPEKAQLKLNLCIAPVNDVFKGSTRWTHWARGVERQEMWRSVFGWKQHLSLVG